MNLHIHNTQTQPLIFHHLSVNLCVQNTVVRLYTAANNSERTMEQNGNLHIALSTDYYNKHNSMVFLICLDCSVLNTKLRVWESGMPFLFIPFFVLDPPGMAENKWNLKIICTVTMFEDQLLQNEMALQEFQKINSYAKHLF